MSKALRTTGISIVGDVPWGTHFCFFYQTREDLIDAMGPYFRSGLDRNEFCLWIIANHMTEKESWDALNASIPALNRHRSNKAIEIVRAKDWYFRSGNLNPRQALTSSARKLFQALRRGFSGMRVGSDTAWLKASQYASALEFEQQLDAALNNQPVIVACAYPLRNAKAAHVLDAAQTHQFSIACRNHACETIAAPHLRQIKNELRKATEKLDERVARRTADLLTLKDQLAAETNAARGLHELNQRRTAQPDLRSFLQNVLDSIVRLNHADFGCICLFDSLTGNWQPVAQRGFDSESLAALAAFHANQTAFNHAWTVNQQTIIEDARGEPALAPLHALADKTGFHTLQTAPLPSRDNAPAGRLSLFFKKPHRPSEQQIRWTDLYAQCAVDFIERHHPAITRSALSTPARETPPPVSSVPEFGYSNTDDPSLQAHAELAYMTRVMLMGEFAASLAHEVNQPLGAIVSNANFCFQVLTENNAPREAREALLDIGRDANRASAVIARVRAMTQRSPATHVSLRLEEVIHEVLKFARRELEDRRITVLTDLNPTLPSVYADRIQLQQVILNLLMNAGDAMSTVDLERRVLRITAHLIHLDGKLMVQLAFNDRGIGFEDKDAEQLFHPFFTTKPRGMGLGLCISRSIMEAHGGRLWATANEGVGATFHCALPVEHERKLNNDNREPSNDTRDLFPH